MKFSEYSLSNCFASCVAFPKILRLFTSSKYCFILEHLLAHVLESRIPPKFSISIRDFVIPGDTDFLILVDVAGPL